MTTIDATLEDLGVLWVPDVLDAETCADLCAEIATGEAADVPAHVPASGGAPAIRARLLHYNTSRVRLPAAREREIRESVGALRPRLEEHYGTALPEVEPCQFLVYGVGNAIGVHRDSDPTAEERNLRERKVTTVLFLNDADESDDAPADTYAGGELMMHRGLDVPPAPSPAGAGGLVAFPSELYHEVRPVIRGERYTVDTWLR